MLRSCGQLHPDSLRARRPARAQPSASRRATGRRPSPAWGPPAWSAVTSSNSRGQNRAARRACGRTNPPCAAAAASAAAGPPPWTCCSLAAVAVLLQALAPQQALAHTALQLQPLQQQREQQQQQQASAGFDPAAVAAARAGPAARAGGAGTPQRGRQPSPTASAAAEVLSQLSVAQQAAQEGRYRDALEGYSGVVREHPDLALAEHARLGRGLMLYQLGDASGALVALEDQSVAMRGAPEVHAALAAVLYAERPGQRLRAEQQFDVATEFDPHYSDAEWVLREKHWPPRLVAALEQFLLLQ